MNRRLFPRKTKKSHNAWNHSTPKMSALSFSTFSYQISQNMQLLDDSRYSPSRCLEHQLWKYSLPLEQKFFWQTQDNWRNFLPCWLEICSSKNLIFIVCTPIQVCFNPIEVIASDDNFSHFAQTQYSRSLCFWKHLEPHFQIYWFSFLISI